MFENIQNAQDLLFTFDSRPMSENMKRYIEFYSLPIESVQYCYGFESIAQEMLFLQSFRPTQAKAHILLLHGYCDHAGILSAAIRFFVQKDFHVFTFDLPGHGLSTGERGDISEFSFYEEGIREVVNRYLSSSSLPIYLVAHSTGAAAAIDYILNNPDSSQIRKATFISPLVRSYRWHVSTLCLKPIKLFTGNLKRVFRKNSSDSKFLHFVKNDPLQYNQLPISWVEALIRWNEWIKDGESSTVPILILQGKKDTTVDWKYNINFLLKKFPNTDIKLIKNGKHHLLNEEKQIRNKIFSSIHSYLTDDL